MPAGVTLSLELVNEIFGASREEYTLFVSFNSFLCFSSTTVSVSLTGGRPSGQLVFHSS